MNTRAGVRIALGYLTLSALLVGVWAAAAPHSFFASFPGLGLRWVASDGPFNEHLVRDVGELNLALAALTLIAAVRPTRVLATTAAVAWLVDAVPHFLYHALNLQAVPSGQEALELVSLAVPIGLAALVIVLAPAAGAVPAATAAGSSPVR